MAAVATEMCVSLFRAKPLFVLSTSVILPAPSHQQSSTTFCRRGSCTTTPTEGRTTSLMRRRVSTRSTPESNCPRRRPDLRKARRRSLTSAAVPTVRTKVGRGVLHVSPHIVHVHLSSSTNNPHNLYLQFLSSMELCIRSSSG